MNKKFTAGASALIAVAIAAVGLNAANAQTYAGSLKLLTFSQANTDLENEAVSFEAQLPVGVDWPTKLPESFNTSGARFEDSVPEVMLAQYWLCAWESDVLQQVAQGQDPSAPLEQVRSFTNLRVYQDNFIDPENGWIRDVVDPALTGDFSGVQTDFSNSCGYFLLNNPSS